MRIIEEFALRKTWLLTLLIVSLLSGCALPQGAAFDPVVPVGSLWKVPLAASGDLTWDSASELAKEEHDGYLQGRQSFKDVKFSDKEAGEGSQTDDIQITVRKMAENEKVVAILGSTTNSATMRISSLVNFFNIPMIIPSATGDNVTPSTNVWAFRLSAPGSAYASYMFGTVIKQSNLVVNAAPTAIAVPNGKPVVKKSDTTATTNTGIKLAILYEQNTFGESSAVATARAALKQGLNIVVYSSFTPETPDQSKLDTLVDNVIQQGTQMIYMISNDSDTAITLMATLRSRYSDQSFPMTVGQAGGFTSTAFQQSDEADGVYVVRQQLDRNNCPAEIETINQAQDYAAIFLLNLAVKQAETLMPRTWWNNPFQAQDQEAKTLTTFREKVRDTLKVINVEVPCLGMVTFDNAGQNKQVQFELTQINGGSADTISVEDFQQDLPQQQQ
jgi:ABC-type branched-subunit amino acid transport system substrate-binding protein